MHTWIDGNKRVEATAEQREIYDLIGFLKVTFVGDIFCESNGKARLESHRVSRSTQCTCTCGPKCRLGQLLWYVPPVVCREADLGFGFDWSPPRGDKRWQSPEHQWWWWWWKFTLCSILIWMLRSWFYSASGFLDDTDWFAKLFRKFKSKMKSIARYQLEELFSCGIFFEAFKFVSWLLTIWMFCKLWMVGHFKRWYKLLLFSFI